MSVISISGKDSFISLRFIIKEKIKPTFISFKNIIKVGYSVFFEQILLRIGFMLTAIMAAHQGNQAMAAHQVAMNLLGLSFSFGDGLQIAAVALIGRSLGEKDPKLAKKYGNACQLIGGVVSVMLAAVYFSGAKPFMRLFFKEDEIVGIGVGLIYILIPIVLIHIRQIVYMGCLRGAGDTFYTAVTSTVSITFVRSAFSYLLGYVFGLGITGIWLGIFTDQIVRFIMAFLRYRKGKWVNIRI